MTGGAGAPAPAPAEGLAVEVLADAESAGRAAAARIAREALPWERFDVFQVDERAAPDGDPDRNWTHICVDLLARLGEAGPRLHPVPAALANLDAAAARYGRELEAAAGEEEA